MIRLRIICFCVGLSVICGVWPQRPLRLMEYNVENLFDTLRCEETADTEFLPSGFRKWNTPRYMKKIGMLARAIAAAGGERPVDLVVLCEVENDSVVGDLTGKTALRRLGYDFVVTHGADPRGVEVALLYRPLRFRLLHAESFRPSGVGGRWATRDVLHVCGMTQDGDTLDVFGLHLPSRSGGTSAGRRRREIAAYVRERADSVVRRRRQPRVVITGDFNDEAHDASIRKSLCGDGRFVVLHPEPGTVGGTYRYKGKWNELDHFVVNAEMNREACCRARILDAGFLLEEDAVYGGYKPFRTYLGPIYRGGISDHLPIVLECVP